MNKLNLMDREKYLVNRKQQLIERKAQYEMKVAEVRAEIEEKQGKVTAKELANLRYKELLYQNELDCIYNKLGIEIEQEPVKEENEVVIEIEQEESVEPVEEWRDIEGYEDYQVSNMGQVKSFKQGRKGKIMTLSKNYMNENLGLGVSLRKDNKSEWHRISYLVLSTFVNKPEDDKFYVPLHLDGDERNNRLDNLMWANELNDIPIYCLTTNMLYKSATVAQEIDGYNSNDIIKNCKGILQYAGELDNGKKCKWKFFPKKSYEQGAKGRNKINAIEELNKHKSYN